MLSRVNRFHGHGGVRRVYRQGRTVRGSLVSLHIDTGSKITATRVAVVVSKKVDKSAVKRNRIRRRVYEVVREQLPAMKVPAHLVFTVYSAEIINIPADDLAKVITEQLSQAGTIK